MFEEIDGYFSREEELKAEEAYLKKEDRMILVGDDAEHFLKSDLGEYILDSAAEEVVAAVEQLKVIDPGEMIKIARLQAKIQVAEDFKQWLNDAINSGREILTLRKAKEETR